MIQKSLVDPLCPTGANSSKKNLAATDTTSTIKEGTTKDTNTTTEGRF